MIVPISCLLTVSQILNCESASRHFQKGGGPYWAPLDLRTSSFSAQILTPVLLLQLRVVLGVPDNSTLLQPSDHIIVLMQWDTSDSDKVKAEWGGVKIIVKIIAKISVKIIGQDQCQNHGHSGQEVKQGLGPSGPYYSIHQSMASSFSKATEQ